jgi:hypothetical protein
MKNNFITRPKIIIFGTVEKKAVTVMNDPS